MAKIKVGKVVTKRKPSTKPKKSAAVKESEDRKKRIKTGKAAKARPAGESDRRAYGHTFKLKKFDSPGIRALPDTPYTRQGMSLRKLLNGTPRLFINNAKDVDAHGAVKRLRTKTGKPMLRGIMWTNDPYRPFKVRRYHETYIIGLDDNQDKEVHMHKKVLVQCQCVTGDTKVLTSEGWKTVFELAEPLVPKHYPISYNVRGTYHKGTAPFYTGMKKVYKLELSNGTSVTATGDHRFLQHTNLGNNKFVESWTELKDLNVGDALISNAFDPGKVERDREYWEAFFIGVLMGDGTVFASGRPNLKLHNVEKTKLLKPLIKLGLVKDVSPVKGREDSVNVQLTHRALELCARYQFVNKKSVRIENAKQCMGYVSGLVATDGTVYKRGDILLRGAKEYLEQLHWLLMQYGYTQGTLYMERAAGVTTNKIVKEGSYVAKSTKEMWAIRISNQSGILENVALCGYQRKRITQLPTQKRKPWVKVVSIQYAGVQHVYDISVPGVKRFAANGVIAHNCEAFVFNFEYANATVGASRLIYSNGQPPVYTNPGLMPGMCKHLVALYKIAKTYNL